MTKKRAALTLSVLVWLIMASILWGIYVSFETDCLLHNPAVPLVDDCVSRSGWLVFGVAAFLFAAEALRTYFVLKATAE